MRATIKARLADELSAIAGRCYDANEPTSATVKPFVTVKLAEQANDSPWLGMRRKYEVALYEETSAAADLDHLSEQAVTALHEVKLSAGPSLPGFTCRFEGMAVPERVDDTLQAIVHVLKFSVHAVGIDEYSSSDDWLDALCDWTGSHIGAEWSLYRHRWPQHYTSPAVMWRLERMEAADRGGSAVELRKKAIGHVIGRTEVERLAMVEHLTTKLGGVTKLLLEPVAKRYIVPDMIAGDFQADGLSEGQLSVTFRQVVNKTAPGGPLIGQVHFDGGFG